MHEQEENLYITRIERFFQRLKGTILAERVPMKAQYTPVQQAVPFNRLSNLAYRNVAVGDIWGRRWESAWFRLSGTIPPDWHGAPLVAHLDFGGEGLVLDREGNILQGISNGSVFDAEFARDIVRLSDACEGGRAVELWVEAAASGLFGMFTEFDPPHDSPMRYGRYDARVTAMDLARFDEARWQLWLDVRLIRGLIRGLDATSVRRARLIHAANDMIDAYSTGSSVEECRAILRETLPAGAAPSALTVTAIGHAHIDTAWLWPVRETIRKCARTFASQLSLIDRFPNYIFGASQAQHYAFVKEHYPQLYARIKEAIARGRWEVQGGMWVEADCNLISGESMVRQIVHGKNFFRDEFEVEVDNLWLPDVFGYSAALPQILRKSGIDYFLTQKISWNQFNKFPHHTFAWRGIDGSEVISHFPPEDTYNSQLEADSLIRAEKNFAEKAYLNEFVSLFGVGDGGGGPKEDQIELGLRQGDCEGAPKLQFGTARDYFHRLEAHRGELPVWAGELYLELHRGTLTTQAVIKKYNRQLEQHLRLAEMLHSCGAMDRYPAEELDRIWKTVLLNQFHDIIPGSSITMVYETARIELGEALDAAHKLIERASSETEPDPDICTVFNGTSAIYDGPVELPEGWAGATGDGVTEVQGEEFGAVASVRIEPYSFATLRRGESGTPVEYGEDLVLENDCVRYEFERDGTILTAWDKEAGCYLLDPNEPGNLFALYEDRPNDWDAWDIDIFYERTALETPEPANAWSLGVGPVRAGLCFEVKVGQSTIMQRVYLPSGGRQLTFRTNVAWREKHKMLRVSFPAAVAGDRATFDIQYGYVRRNTHRNTSWDTAQFETVGHRYADLSRGDLGVALLNDCKYGYKVHDNRLDLCLLRAPTYPDPDADQGEHEFTYSLLPHPYDHVRGGVITAAAHLNGGVAVLPGFKPAHDRLPWRVAGEGLSLEVVKKAEKEDCLVLRIVETNGQRSIGRLEIDDKSATLVGTDLMEWTDGEQFSCAEPLPLELEPFEIVTFKLKSKKEASDEK